MGVDTAAQHPVDAGYPYRDLGAVGAVPDARGFQQRLGPRKDRYARSRDPIGVPSTHEPAATQLVHLDLTFGAAAVERGLQLDQAIHHGMLRRKRLAVE